MPKTRCPPGYNDIFTFVQRGQSAAIWTLAIIAIVEVMTAMVFLVPDVYNQIKEKGRQEGLAKGRAKGRAEAREKGRAIGERAERERFLAAMREAGVDEETRRRVEDELARSAARRNDN